LFYELNTISSHKTEISHFSLIKNMSANVREKIFVKVADRRRLTSKYLSISEIILYAILNEKS